LVEAAEERELGLFAFDNRFDYEIGFGERLELGARAQPANRGLAIGGGHPPSLDGAIQIAPDPVDTAPAEILRYIAQDYIDSGLRGDLCDSRAHLAGAYYP
jgi:hypothetical protein